MKRLPMLKPAHEYRLWQCTGQSLAFPALGGTTEGDDRLPHLTWAPQSINALLTLVLLAVAVAVAWHYDLVAPWLPRTRGNAIVVISPYRYKGTWVFDDPASGLVREPFVAGIPQMIDQLVADIPDAEKGFRLYFSASPFPGYQKKLTWVRADSTGNWYRTEDPPMEGWLCPALMKYYRTAPKEIYVKAEPSQEPASQETGKGTRAEPQPADRESRE